MPTAAGRTVLTTPRSRLPLAGRRVLLADDEADMRAMLERAGADVLAAKDGNTALGVWRVAAAAGRSLHAAVLDQRMPGRSGAGVAAALRVAGFAGLVVLVSSAIEPKARELWLAAGCDAVVDKLWAHRDLVPAVAAPAEDRVG